VQTVRTKTPQQPNPEAASLPILLAEFGGSRIALRAADVRGVLRAVTVAPLPGAPPVVEGIIDVRGRLNVVYDLRPRLRLPPKPTSPDDHLILARSGGRDVALRVDRAVDLLTVPLSRVHDPAMPGARALVGVVSLPDGLVLIHDLHAFLTEAESEGLDAALAAVGER
jgi:purine-binding chemotaxis protein CheW